MKQFIENIPMYIEQSGIIAPILFILFHLVRPLLFVPVVFVCMVGGLLFGIIYGTIFSIIGLTFMCILFYYVVRRFPSVLKKFETVNKKVMKNRTLTLDHIFILRIVPFIHFHLLSLYTMENTQSFVEYSKQSFMGVILPAFIFTSFGHLMIDFSLYESIILLSIVMILFMIISKKEAKKVTNIKWKNFFKTS